MEVFMIGKNYFGNKSFKPI